MPLRFGEFDLDQERRQLLRSGQPVPLEPKAYDLLTLLVERRPRALSRAQIRDVVWPQTFISESTLAVTVNAIRQALCDDARNPRFIRTVHGFGYAFCGEATDEELAGSERRGTCLGGERRGEPCAPYPGLSSFTEEDAGVFFGREAEVEALWERIRRRGLLAVVGPSGVGKTSFLRAGVIASRPPDWAVAYATPGSGPAFALAHALIPDLAGDAEAIEELVQGVRELSLRDEPGRALAAVKRWRQRSEEALLILDQFEELFALNTVETQASFAGLLGRLAEEADVHVLLSLRDDFLFRCGEEDTLRPVFEDLTPLYPPSPDALRRALVEPAARRGVRFEDEALVDEMVGAVEEERGALPLLAFAVSRLWEERDRDRKLLTREAYERVGGVAGALAHHAETTLARLGPQQEGVVREIFRNLVSAQGTRAAVDRAEVLSVFRDRRDQAGAVLDVLVDARLLTEYEAPDSSLASPPVAPPGKGTSSSDERSESAHRLIEIVHESLLSHWPRLVRWRTQDADGALLRDQLRQAAHLWDGRGRPDDLLWTGASYLDYGAWRARHTGGLSTLEEAFGQAMATLANQQRRRRQIAVAAVLASLVLGLGAVGTLWTRSEAARRRADAEALRAEARQLLALGQAERERNPTAALAYTTSSLELLDTEEARRLALRVLQRGPTALRTPAAEPESDVAFSPDGEWLVGGGSGRAHVRHRDGGPSLLVPLHDDAAYRGDQYALGPESQLLFVDRFGEITIWPLPDGRDVRRFKIEQGVCQLFMRGPRLFTATDIGQRTVIRRAPLDEGDLALVGIGPAGVVDIDVAGAQMAYVLPAVFRSGRRVYVRSLEDWAKPPRLVATHPAGILAAVFHPHGRQVAVADRSGRINIWTTDGGSERPLRILDCAGVFDLTWSPRGRWLAAVGAGETSWYAKLWDLTAPRSTLPLQFPVASLYSGGLKFDPSERWLATVRSGFPPGIDLWPLGETYPRSVGEYDWFVDDVVFTPDGSTLVSAAGDGSVHAHPMSPHQPGPDKVLLREGLNYPRIAADASAKHVAVSTNSGAVVVLAIAGGEAHRLEGFSWGPGGRIAVAFSPDGRRLAAAPAMGPAGEKVIRIWDLESGACRILLPIPGAGDGDVGGVSDLSFVDDDHIVASSPTSGVFSFDLREGGHKILSSRPARALVVGRRARTILAVLGAPEEVVRMGLDGQRPTRVFSCPGCMSVAVDPTDAIVATGSTEGIVRVGPVSGGEPHLFFSQTVSPQRVAFSPDGRWVASSGERPSVRLWPVPDVTRTPPHKRSHEELLATLHSWTNLRAVKDPQSSTGWTLEPGPFPGWEMLPHW